jgi:hypothetical protein
MVLAVSMLAPKVRAATADPEALIRTGVELRKQGADDRAEVYFRQAYEIAPTPRSAAQLGLVELALDRFLAAETYLSEALRSHDVWIETNRPTLVQSRDMARSHLARVRVADAPADTTVTLPNGESRKLAGDGVVWVAPGPVSFRIQAEGAQEITYSRNLAPGETDNVAMKAIPAPEVKLAPTAQPAASDVSGVDQGRGIRIAGIVTASVGVAGLATGLILYEIAGSKLNAINQEASSEGSYDESKGSWRTFDRAGVGLLVGGGVAVAGGAALYLWGRSEHTGETHVSFFAAPGSQMLTLAGAF